MDINEQILALRTLEVLPIDECKKHDIQSVMQGGFIEFKNDTWKVLKLHRYLDVKWKNFAKRKKDYWITQLELLSLTTSEKIFIDWKVDDELEVCLTDAEIKIRDIQYNKKPLTRADIDYIEDEEQGQVNYNGVVYHYSDDDTWAGLLYESIDDAKNKVNETPLRVYEFESDDDQYLSVEAWYENEDKATREAYLSHSIKSNSIRILQLST